MFRKLFRRQPVPAAACPPGVLIYAVGDVHGRADLLEPLIEGLVADSEATEAEETHMVFLGDYVDRGPDSRKVVDLLLGLAGRPGIHTHFLRGNHDETLLEFLQDPEVGPSWCEYGGRDTLKSYGVTAPTSRINMAAWATVAQAFELALPPEHRAFFENLENSVTLGDYFFCHAGARPGVPLDQQSQRDLLWIREAFLADHRGFAQVVVHGHTPAELAYSDARRIGVDTGAYATGLLTAVKLYGSDRSLVQAAAPMGAPPMIAHGLFTTET